MTPFNENALKLAPWSATKWKTATGCPFRAYHAWVVKAKEEWDVLPDDSPMIIGIKMHTFMELVLGKFPKDVFPEMTDLNVFGGRMLKVILKDEDLSYKERDAINSLYHGALSTCQRFLSHRFKTNSKSFVEVPVGIDKNFQPIDFFDKSVFFRGKIDYMMVTPKGAVAIIDAKTGAWPSLKSHTQQLRAYEVLALHALKNKMIQDYNITLSSFISGLAYIASEEVLWDRVRPISLVEGSGTKSFVDSLNAVSDQVFEKKIIRGNHCNYCGYKHLCGSRRGKMGKKVQEIKM